MAGSNIKAFVYNSWEGGQATDKKTGIANSFADSQSLDFRTSPSQLSVLPATRRADNGVVTDLVQDEVMTNTGTTYAVGSSGNIYTVSPAGTWSLFGNIGEAGSFGINWREDQDAVYIPGQVSVSQISNISTAPILTPGFYGISQSTYDNTANAGFNVNSNQSGGTQTTAIGTSYSENISTEERFFQTDIQPIYSIGVNIVSKGTGDWTLVVHDGLNNVLGTTTITNANLVNGQFNQFIDVPPLQINVPASNTAGGTSSNVQTYHWHLTSTVADGTVASTAVNDLSTADMNLYANRLVQTKNGIHPQVTFQQFEVIGNGRYLSVWEPLGDPAPSNSEWERQGLSFPPGYEVCGLTVFNEYLVIATELTVTGANTAQQGILFYWDGLSSTYNYFTQIPEGSPESLHEYENAIYYVAGGNWYTITSVNATPQKIRRLPGTEDLYTESNTPTRLNPNMGTVRYGIHLLGWPSTTTNQSIPYGIYTWGQTDTTQPYSFGYSYLLSTGTQFVDATNNLTIGMVKNFGNVLHMSWRDDGDTATPLVSSNFPPTAASDVVFGNLTWNNPTNILASDNTYATVTVSGVSGTSHYLQAGSYGFNIPSNATITGIQVNIEKKASANVTLNHITDNVVRLVKSNGSLGTTNKADTSTFWATSDTVISYGGVADLWGDAWTPADINSTNFGAVLAISTTSNASLTASVDQITMTVYYTSITPKYGVDIVDASSGPTPYASWESLIEDSSIPTKQKLASYVEAKWLDIQDGVGIVLKYAINRGEWTYSPMYSNANLWAVDGATNYARLDVGDSNVEERFYEVQIGIDIYCDDTVTEPPIVVGVSLIFDTLGAEVLQ